MPIWYVVYVIIVQIDISHYAHCTLPEDMIHLTVTVVHQHRRWSTPIIPEFNVDIVMYPYPNPDAGLLDRCQRKWLHDMVIPTQLCINYIKRY